MSNGNTFKQQIFTQFARVGKALSNSNRLELLEFLAQGERCVESLARVACLPVANVSQHLQQLRQAGLVVSRKEGLKVYYQLSGDDVACLFKTLCQVAEQHLADVNQLVSNHLFTKDRLEPVPREELFNRVRDGQVVAIDVRPTLEYAAGHVLGAVNIPLDELEQHLEGFDPKQEIIAYCRGPYCVLAFDAVVKLRQKGLKARRLEDGYPEWKLAALPVEES